jgi:hypothetical protein
MLARLAQPKPPSAADLAATIAELCAPGTSPDRARDLAAELLAALRTRSLVTAGRVLTDAGARVLRDALGLTRTPSWRDVQSTHLVARALGMSAADDALAKRDPLVSAVLRDKLAIDEVSRTTVLCDALLADALGLPRGPLTLRQLRAHALARHPAIRGDGAPPQIRPTEGLDAFAARVAGAAVGAAGGERRQIARALARAWVRGDREPGAATPASHPPLPTPPAATAPPAPGVPRNNGPTQIQAPPATETVLEVVRETIPRVGAEGRFGSEKVFVSAIWRSIEQDRRLVDLSLDRFKHWLVSANRQGWLVLARADLVGAMDARQVAESEIEDRGATFHFVLDQQPRRPTHRDHHAR